MPELQSQTSPAVRVEKVGCLICGSSRIAELFDVEDEAFPHTPRMKFPLGECLECGFRFLRERPTVEDIHHFYTSNYYVDGQVRRFERDEAAKVTLRTRAVEMIGRRNIKEKLRRAETMLNGRTNARVLDVGCGTGDFLYHLKSRGHSVTGCEFDPEMCRLAKDKFGLDLWQGDLASYPAGAARFDLITFWESLEHLHNAHACIEKAHSLLAPGGALIVSVPNGGSLADSTAIRMRRSAQDFPRHLYLFSSEALTRLLEDRGFEKIAFSFWTSLNGPRWSFALAPIVKSLNSKGMGALAKAVKLGGRSASYVLDAGLSLVGRSAGLVVTARRPV